MGNILPSRSFKSFRLFHITQHCTALGTVKLAGMDDLDPDHDSGKLISPHIVAFLAAPSSHSLEPKKFHSALLMTTV
jgi:hypothetical protein